MITDSPLCSLPITFSYNACNFAIIYVDIYPPTNVTATVLSSRSIQITWIQSTPKYVTGYLITYSTTTPFTSFKSERMNGGYTMSRTIGRLEEDTRCTITIQAITSDNRMSANSSEVSVRTYTDGK